MSRPYIKKIIIIVWILPIILVNLSFSARNLFIKNDKSIDNITKSKIDNDNNTLNLSSQNKNILLQIDILKNTILMNNSILKNYNKIFSHNITYQINVISRKIIIANSSIKSEINILNRMIDIMEVHPYNYLKLFQKNNYIIPNISTKNNKKVLNKINNIESFSSKLNEKFTNINNIVYQSEEETMSISSTISVISSLRLLLFKKVNIAYCNILYFSHYLNNLSSVSKYYKNNDYKRDNHLITNNKLINNNKINDKNQSIGNNNIAKYLKNKSYIYMTPIFIIGIISIIIMTGGKDKITKKLSSSGKGVPSNSNYKSEIELIDFSKIKKPKKLKKLKKPKKKGSVSVQSDIKNPVLENNLTAETELIVDDARDPWSTISLSDWPVKSLNDILSSIDLPQNPFYKITSGESDHKTMDTDQNYVNKEPELSEIFPDHIVNKISEDQLTLLHSPDNIPPIPSSISMEQKQTDSYQKIDYMDDGKESSDEDKDMEIQDVRPNVFTQTSSIEYKRVAKRRKNKIQPDIKSRRNYAELNKWIEQTKDLKITGTNNSYTIESDDFPPDIIVYIMKEKTNEPTYVEIAHTHYDYITHPKSFIEEPKYFLLFSREKKEELIRKWFDTEPSMQKMFCRKLYLDRVKGQQCRGDAFLSQARSYFYQIKLSSEQQWIRPNSYHILANIRKNLDSTENHALSANEKKESLFYIKKIARFQEKRTYSKDASYTTHGWFKDPAYKDFRNINSENITKEDYEYLQNQLKKFNNVESLLPNTYENKEYYETLLLQIKSDKFDHNISQLDKFIANEILNDLKEVITKYKSFVNIEAINKSELPKKLKKRFKFPDYIWKFGEYTRLQRSGYDGISHNGISEDSLFTLFNSKWLS